MSNDILIESGDHGYRLAHIYYETVVYNKSDGSYYEYVGQELQHDEVLIDMEVAI